MNSWLGWALAALAMVVGYVSYGWQGVILGVTVVSFWLVLQFSRAMRVMRTAAQSPVGHVKSALMMSTKLRAGMRMLDVVTMTRSLGQQLSEAPEIWRWTDAGGDAVDLSFDQGRLRQWTLQRPGAGGTGDAAP
ncbi:hypothetical protein V4F39_24670 [Aquincola sp. MAHUQ-54]|uniref:Glycerate kinase n=1 Tax=Aquincola agrisoli TaxID=3119538 RepID=A0AAW9QIP2_9BURK